MCAENLKFIYNKLIIKYEFIDSGSEGRGFESLRGHERKHAGCGNATKEYIKTFI
jgi:hypothetical protein